MVRLPEVNPAYMERVGKHELSIELLSPLTSIMFRKRPQRSNGGSGGKREKPRQEPLKYSPRCRKALYLVNRGSSVGGRRENGSTKIFENSWNSANKPTLPSSNRTW